MENSIENLDWDSEFFGYKVASIRAFDLNFNKMSQILEELQSKEVKLAYFFSDPEDKTSEQSVFKANGILVDEKTTYYSSEFKVNENLNSESIKPYRYTHTNENLKKLALQSGLHSRFRIDPGFKNEEYNKLYLKWIDQSVKKIIADEVFVYLADNIEKGFVTIKVKDKTGFIGLIAVDESERGKSIGRKLVNRTFVYLNDMAVGKLEVVTQKSNKAACNFYESIGFSVKSTKNIYHLWIK